MISYRPLIEIDAVAGRMGIQWPQRGALCDVIVKTAREFCAMAKQSLTR